MNPFKIKKTAESTLDKAETTLEKVDTAFSNINDLVLEANATLIGIRKILTICAASLLIGLTTRTVIFINRH